MGLLWGLPVVVHRGRRWLGKIYRHPYFVSCITPRREADSHLYILIYRVNMCTLAAEETSSWLMIDPWEAFQKYQRTAVVLDHFDYEINTILGGVHTQDGEHRDVRVMLLAGSDLISTMSEPGVWSVEDVSIFRCVRSGSSRKSPLVVGPHTRPVRHVHHRTGRFQHGSSNG